MKVNKVFFLRGPNIYSNATCIKAVIDLESLDDVSSADIPGFVDALCQLIPTLDEHRCSPGYPGGFVERLRRGTYMAHIVEHVTIELQCLAGTDVGFGRARAVPGEPRCYAVVCEYKIESLAAEALADAVELVGSLARGEKFPLEERLASLRRIFRRRRLGPSTEAIVTAARHRNIPCRRITEDASLFQLGTGSRQQRIQATITSRSSYIAVEIASDKELTKFLLKGANVPVPRGTTVYSADEALADAASLRPPFVVKPLDANQGKGVTTRLRIEEIAGAVQAAQQFGKAVMIEEYIEGEDYRVLVVDSRVVAASRRAPPSVQGDGVSTIRVLIERENARPERGEGHGSALTYIPVDDTALRQLAAHGHTLETVLPVGMRATLRGNANLSTGGTAQDVTDFIHPEVAAACVRAANAVGLDVAGVDLVCSDIGKPLAGQGGAVIEVNAAPGIRMHERPSIGRPRAAGDAIVKSLFADRPACIPIVAVTGTNGKTTTVRLIEHAVRGRGFSTGMCNSEGIYKKGQQIASGDCSGYWSAQSVLAALDTEFAILEVARGGILKRGLGFESCDVGVVLNIDADHLGQDGIVDVDGIARVKAVVAEAATRAVVLNADDARCVAMTKRIGPDGNGSSAEIVFFSMSYNNSVVASHLEKGGRAFCLAGDSLVLRTRQKDDFLIPSGALPFSLGGAARHNIANALAAVAALTCTGFEPVEAAKALESFETNTVNNPLRLNLAEIEGIRVVVDYAHNAAAYKALAATVRKLTRGRLIGVITAPGDRRDEELSQIGEVCAELFDDLIIYEMDDLRGRAPGETAAAIARGISPAGVRVIPDVREALATAVLECGRQDSVVFGCASDLGDVEKTAQIVLSRKAAHGKAMQYAQPPRATAVLHR